MVQVLPVGYCVYLMLGGSSGIASLFSTVTITTLFAFIGICLKTFGKRTTHKNVGNIMLGFAILMTGMQQNERSRFAFKNKRNIR